MLARRLLTPRTPLLRFPLRNRALHVSPTLYKSKLTEQDYDENEPLSRKLDSEPYYAKRDSEARYSHQQEQGPGSSKEDLKKFQTVEAIIGLGAGLLTIGAIIGGYNLYTKWPQIEAWWKDDDLFDVKMQKRKRKNAIEIPQLKNPNDSSVPGLYLCGDNANKIVKNSKDREFRYFVRNDWFDNKYLKSVVVGATSALAVDDRGDLIQWGVGYNKTGIPEVSVKGQGIKKAKFSNGVIYALNKKDEILIIPEDAKTQKEYKSSYKNWFRRSKESYTKLNLSLLAKNEKIKDFDTGREHLVLLTTLSKAYVCSTGLRSDSVTKSFGQYGIPSFSHFNKPPAPNRLYDIELLNNQITKKSKVITTRKIEKIACGNFHTLALDSNGEVFSFGNNTYGQLGHPTAYETENIPYPKKIDLFRRHVDPDEFARALDIKVCGDTNFVEIEPMQRYHMISNLEMEEDEDEVIKAKSKFIVGFGNNLKAQIGNGHFIHSQFDPVKLKELERFEDYNDQTKQMERIPIKEWTSGNEQTFIKLANKDVLYWGANDFGQLGNGKKSRVSKPSNPPAIFEPNFTKETYKDPKFVNRLQLNENQHLLSGENVTGVFYTKN